MTALDKQAREWLFANGWAVNEDPPYSCWWHPATDEYGVKEIDLPVVLAAFATQVREQTVAEKWVSVAERLPEENDVVIAAWGQLGIGALYYQAAPITLGDESDRSEGFYLLGNMPPEKVGNVTHWQPLPAPPETTEQEER